MTDLEKLDLLIAELRIIAARSTRYEMNVEYSPSDDGNFNDAYNDGFEDGMTVTARDLLELIKG